MELRRVNRGANGYDGIIYIVVEGTPNDFLGGLIIKTQVREGMMMVKRGSWWWFVCATQDGGLMSVPI